MEWDQQLFTKGKECSCLFPWFNTQWFSSGKITRRLGMPSLSKKSKDIYAVKNEAEQTVAKHGKRQSPPFPEDDNLCYHGSTTEV